MRLRNKKTGEIIDVDFIYPETAEFFYPNFKLVDFNELFEDYEEPKEHWIINSISGIETTDRDEEDEPGRAMIEIGNYFETKEEAEKAVEKLKAWKRLKDKGFRFKGINMHDGSIKTGLSKGVSFNDCEGFYDMMTLLFGGEE